MLILIWRMIGDFLEINTNPKSQPQTAQLTLYSSKNCKAEQDEKDTFILTQPQGTVSAF